MNLRADLLLPQERRSPSVVNLRFVYRVLGIVVPLILGLMLAMAVLQSVALARRVKDAEREWASTEPRKDQALRVLNQARINDGILGELEGWKAAAPRWHDPLVALQHGIAPAIQLRELRISQSLNLVDSGGPAARNFSWSLSGTAVGAAAERAVQSLQQLCMEAEAFRDRVASATIPSYQADPVARQNRLFRIEVLFKPLEFK